MCIQEIGWGLGLGSSGSGQGQLTDYSEYGNGHSCSIKWGENYRLVEKLSASQEGFCSMQFVSQLLLHSILIRKPNDYQQKSQSDTLRIKLFLSLVWESGVLVPPSLSPGITLRCVSYKYFPVIYHFYILDRRPRWTKSRPGHASVQKISAASGESNLHSTNVSTLRSNTT